MINFVSDSFVEHYVGGAELTTEALISKSLLPTRKILSKDISIDLLEKLKDDIFIFTNFSQVPTSCLLYAVRNLNYYVIEYDFKFCKYRSPEKHIVAEGKCDCSTQNHGKLVCLFLASAKHIFWMSEGQRQVYHKNFSPLKKIKEQSVLSSMFSDETFETIENLKGVKKNNKYLILNSQSWIKGAEDCVKYAKDNDLEYELVWGLKHGELLKKMAASKGIIFMPRGGDTCPRWVIEAMMLDCDVIANDNVMHKDEEWFNPESCVGYLKSRPYVFWKKIAKDLCPYNVDVHNHFKIIIPFYNVKDYLPRCVESLNRQRYRNFTAYFIDDISTDGSLEAAKELKGEGHLIRNQEKKYALRNIWDTLEQYEHDDEDIVIILDGDDWLAHENVLGKLNEVYNKQECLVTYGNYVYYPYGNKGVEPSAYPEEIIRTNMFRQDKWRASHLRSFKYKLWKHLDPDYLQDDYGDFYKTAYDQAMMLPLLEMASDKSFFINDVLYVYNKENPLNVDKIKAKVQYETMLEIRKKEPCRPL